MHALGAQGCTQRGSPEGLLCPPPSRQLPAARAPCRAGCARSPGRPRVPLTGPGASEAAQRGQHRLQEQKERPATHGREGAGRGAACAARRRLQAVLSSPGETSGGRSAGAPGAGFTPAPAAHWGWLGGREGLGGMDAAARCGGAPPGWERRLQRQRCASPRSRPWLVGGEEWPGRGVPPTME